MHSGSATTPDSTAKGSYVVHVALAADRVIVVRRRAGATRKLAPARAYFLSAGDYLYVGSAHGSAGLAGRVGRHLSPGKKKHWDIDFLLTGKDLLLAANVWGKTTRSAASAECRWVAAILRMPGAYPVHGKVQTSPNLIRGFGAGDCEQRCGCRPGDPASARTHLIRVEWKPSLEQLRSVLGRNLVDIRLRLDL